MAWQRLPISAFLRKSEDWVERELDRIYQQIRVRLWGKGLTLRARIPGANIAARRQLRVSVGQFLISRIDARHGAFGIVPDHLDGALVSNDFPCFDIDERVILPRYFEWYTRTAQFIDHCRRVSEGSTNRIRLKEDRFMSIEVPLPSFAEQQRVAARLARIDRLRQQREIEVAAAERDAHSMLSTAFRRVVSDANRRPMADVAPIVRRRVEIHPEKAYSELGVRSFGRGMFRKPNLRGADLTWQKLYFIHRGDVVISNIKAWEGALAVATEHDHGHVGSHRYLTCVPHTDVIAPDFLWYYLLSREGLEQIVAASPGSADRNRTLGQRALGGIDIPVPSLARQQWFVDLSVRVKKIEALRGEARADTEALLPAVLSVVFGADSYQPYANNNTQRRE